MQTRLPLLSLSLSLSLLLVPAADSAAAQPELELILERHVEAMGGGEHLTRLKTMRIQGLYEGENETTTPLPFTLSLEAPDRLHFELRVANLLFLTITSGSQGWIVDPRLGPGVHELAVEHVDRQRRSTFFTHSMLAKAGRGTITLKGLSQLENGGDVFILETELANGDRATFYVDTETYHVVQQDEVWLLGGAETVVTRYFDDYRLVDGMSIPHRVEEHNSQGWRRYNFLEIELNADLDAALFGRPVLPAPADAAESTGSLP